MTKPGSDGHALTLTARLTGARLDARRGVVRLHPEVLAALGLRTGDPVRLDRRPPGPPAPSPRCPAGPGAALCDDLVLGNLGVRDGGQVTVAPAPLREARRVTLAGPAEAMRRSPPEMLRGRRCSARSSRAATTCRCCRRTLPAGAPAAWSAPARRSLSAAMGTAWTSTLLTVTAAEPADRRWSPWTRWSAGGTAGRHRQRDPVVTATPALATGGATDPEDEPVPSLDDLPGLQSQAEQLSELLDLGFHHGEVLARLGTTAAARRAGHRPGRLGQVGAGPGGRGRGRRTVRPRWGPELAALTQRRRRGPACGAGRGDVRRRRPCC